eukprot:3560764-Rhodomonas_salina.1
MADADTNTPPPEGAKEVVLGEDGQPLSKNALKKLEKAKAAAEAKAAKQAAQAAKAAEAGPAKAKPKDDGEAEDELDPSAYHENRSEEQFLDGPGLQTGMGQVCGGKFAAMMC